MTRRLRLPLLLLIALALQTARPASSQTVPAQPPAGRDALWRIVHEQCVAGMRQQHDPKPCAQVDLPPAEAEGYAILKDRRGQTQFLLIPTGRVSGIESPVLLAPDAPNYFAEAWQARHFVMECAPRPLSRNDISLAVNSALNRSQDQLHIHIDCLSSTVRDLLHSHEAGLRTHWSPFPVPLEGHSYVALWLPGEDLGAGNPFKLLAEQLPGARATMGARTLVVVGLTRRNGQAGFVLLSDQASPDGQDQAYGEELQDHACAAAPPAP